MVEALTQLKELYDMGCFGDNAMSDTYADTAKQMASGKYAMTVAPLTMPVNMEQDYPEAKATSWGFFPIPLVDNQLAPAHPAGPAKFIYSGSKHIVEPSSTWPSYADREPAVPARQRGPVRRPYFSGMKTKWTPEQQAFLDAYPARNASFTRMR